MHQLRVFVGDRALGNATGVVRIGAGERRESMAECARLLGYPDTAFVAVDASGVRVDSFSPYQRVRFCTQTLLATEAVLRMTGSIAPDEPLHLGTPAGTVRVTRHHDGPDDAIAYVDLPGGTRAIRAPRGHLPVPGALLRAAPMVVNTGRARAYCLLSPEEIESVALSPDTVRAFCGREDVTGLCLTARGSDGGVRLRVYTMSLDGAEDSATGGAAGGVPIYWQRLGIESGTAAPRRVHQGFGAAQTRGELWVRMLDTGRFAVGGRVVPVVVGTLAPGLVTAHHGSAPSS